MSGWFKVKRGITSHPIFKKKPERLAIWMWLLDNAAWTDTTHDIKGKTIHVRKGSVCASERRIAEEVGVGRQVVRTFIARLTAEGMINPDTTHGKNVITLCNWDKYQDGKPKDNPAPNPRLTQDQPTKEEGKNIPVGEAAGAAPSETVQVNSVTSMLWSIGKPYLARHGVRDPGKAIGMLLKDAGGSASEVLRAIELAQKAETQDPVPYLRATLRNERPSHRQQPQERSGYVNAGAFGMIPEVG